jgi:hypothetical protein
MTLPPGYEEEMWCPPNHCGAHVPREEGFVGGDSAFWTCRHETHTEEQQKPIWTGVNRRLEIPTGWSRAAECLTAPRILADSKETTSDGRILQMIAVLTIVGIAATIFFVRRRRQKSSDDENAP